ncbi:MAG: hypothetical protein PHG16_04255 [Lachnospiraceae bacterium]|nr:hypothetical protein [Lachnospiraceae bacterium]
MKKLTKAKYPEKTSMNLVMKENESTSPVVLAVGAVIFVIALGLFTKFGVLDRMMEASKAEAAYQEASNYLDSLKEANADYDQIQETYNKMGNAYLSEEERASLDRMDIMGMLQTTVLSRANVSSIDISGSTVTVTITDTRLSDISKIVANLEEDQRTDYVTVSTAGTNDNNAQGGDANMVTADMVINLVASDGTTAASDPTGGDAS